MSPIEALDKACSIAGSATALADRIGVYQSAISNWRTRGKIPADHGPSIERETGVKAEDLCPDVDWAVIRNGTAEPASSDSADGAVAA